MKKIYTLILITLIAITATNCGKSNTVIIPSASPSGKTTDGTSSKDITSFDIVDPTTQALVSTSTIINESNLSIIVYMPYGTSVTSLMSLTPSIVHTGASINPPSGLAQDFRVPVDYTVTAADGSKKTYTVTAPIGTSGAKEITQFNLTTTNFPTGFSNYSCRTGVMSASTVGGSTVTSTNIFIALYPGSNKTALIASFATNGAAAVFIGNTQQISGSLSPIDFTNPVTYRVYAADGSHSQIML